MKRYIKSSKILHTNDLLRYGSINDFIEHNAAYDRGEFLNQAVRYDIGEVDFFLGMRDYYDYTEDTSGDDWEYIDIAKGHHTKYGTNYVFVSPSRGLWRTKTTGAEFYGKPGNPVKYAYWEEV